MLGVLLLILLCFSSVCRAQSSGVNPCDLNQDGKVDVADVQQVTNMYLQLILCSANIAGDAVCSTEVRQRVITTALGGTCITGGPGSVNPHGATLSWTASTSAGVSGYNIYRAAVSGGPYTKVNVKLVTGTTFVDTSVLAGQTYYYVSTAVNTSGAESSYSNEAKGTVPSP